MDRQWSVADRFAVHSPASPGSPHWSLGPAHRAVTIAVSVRHWCTYPRFYPASRSSSAAATSREGFLWGR